MNFDYNKIINYLCGKEINEYAIILKTLVDTHFVLYDAVDNKIIMFDNGNDNKYIISYEKNRILIKRDISSDLTLNDNFGFLMEISFENNIITFSNIFNVDSPSGIMSTTTKYKYDNGFKYITGRMCLLKENILTALSNKQSIDTFISSFYEKRTNKFNDLFWDMDLLRKSLLIDAYVTRPIILNDNTDFNAIYKELLIQIVNTMKELG